MMRVFLVSYNIHKSQTKTQVGNERQISQAKRFHPSRDKFQENPVKELRLVVKMVTKIHSKSNMGNIKTFLSGK